MFCIWGVVHDHFSGMLSIKRKRIRITEIIGLYLEQQPNKSCGHLPVLLMLIVGALFILCQAKILVG